MRNRRWFRVRALAQLLLWLAFIFALIYTRAPLEGNPVYDLFPRLSLHLGIAASITSGKVIASFLPAVIVFAATLLLGRFFCGVICPLGATIDAADKLAARSRPPARADGGAKAGGTARYKHLVLAVSLVLSIAGVQAAGIIDPLSLAVRSYGTAVYPYFDTLIKIIFDGLYQAPGINLVSEPVFDFLKGSVLDFNRIMFLNHLWVFAVFIAILGLAALGRRLWCRALCPLGAMLALAGSASPLRRVVDPDTCTNCRKCVRDCRMNAIKGDGTETVMSECVMCFECLESCSHGAASFRFTNPFAKKPAHTESHAETFGGITRRNILAGTIASAALIPLFRQNPGYRADHAELIRPPGALPEGDFLDACIRCGECMKVCPTNALHPAATDAGLEGIFTPRLVPRIGWCEKNCTLCTQVCPTGAIRKLTAADKETEVIGTAYFIRDLCIPWSEHRDCLVCEEVCPTATKSIKFIEKRIPNKDGVMVLVKLPHVLEKVCIGCGICENKCPVPGSAAIRVRAKKVLPGVRI